MSRTQGVLELRVAPEAARQACRKALAEIGWDVIRADTNVVEAREDPTRLCCHQSPAEAEIRFTEAADGCQVTIETKVPGLGPISSSHARGRQEAIVRRLHRHATQAPTQANGCGGERGSYSAAPIT